MGFEEGFELGVEEGFRVGEPDGLKLGALEGFFVGAEEGFERHGAVDHSDLVVDDCGGGGIPFEDFYGYCGYRPEITRGVFIDEYIYSISHGGVRVHEVETLTPVATATY